MALSSAFYAEAFAAENPRIGDLIMKAKQVYESQGRPSYILDLYTLFGDPAMTVK